MNLNSLRILQNLIKQQSFWKASQNILSINNYAKTFKSMLNDQENFKLFEDNNINERYVLQSGEVEDTSLELGPSNLKMNEGPIIGRNLELHQLIRVVL